MERLLIVGDKVSFRQKIIDYLGSVLGLLCAIHCMLTPALIALINMTQLAFFWSEEGEHLLFISIVILATTSAILSVWKTRSYALFITFMISLAMMYFGHELQDHENSSLGLVISVFGGLGLTFSHLRNLRGVWFFQKAKIDEECACADHH
jgi:hypothetical protein